MSTATEIRIPPLRQGDRLTVEEFERRYDAMPDLKKAELIEGVVYVASPVSAENHGDPHFDLIGWLSMYKTATPGTKGSDNGTVRMKKGANRPQPDVSLRILHECGGQSHIDDDGYLAGAPELVAEVAASSVSYDLHDKLDTYERNGVKEYVVWRVEDQAVDWFILQGGHFTPLPLSSDGCYKSEVFPGLWLDPKALVDGKMDRVIDVLQRGLASAEHKTFVDKLQKEKRPTK